MRKARAGKNHNRRAAHRRYGAALHSPEVAAIWNVSVDTVIRRFRSQPGAIEIGNDDTLHKGRKKLMRILESVLEHESHRSKKPT